MRPRPLEEQAWHTLNWNALRGWHDLMPLARPCNTLACYSTGLWNLVCVRGTLLFLRETDLNPWLSAGRLRALRERPRQLRLMIQPPASPLPTGTAPKGAGLGGPVWAPRGPRPWRRSPRTS